MMSRTIVQGGRPGGCHCRGQRGGQAKPIDLVAGGLLGRTALLRRRVGARRQAARCHRRAGPAAAIWIACSGNCSGPNRPGSNLHAKAGCPSSSAAGRRRSAGPPGGVDPASRGPAGEAAGLLERQKSGRPRTCGSADGRAFEDLRDMDDLTRPFFEVLTSTGKYYLDTHRSRRVDRVHDRRCGRATCSGAARR